ncbi:hypothetical protein [Vibrio metschnikovii]|uniref:hypothetical protein n=1 Tax=Vibrio metschnikovii TaxID=28172 RepID=UPI001C2F9C2A|nr:hypothetical protein [Vibrio metschnikovii]
MYEKENNGDALSCYAYSVSDSDPMEKPIEKYALMLDWDDVRVKLENKNKIMPTLVNWHVSGSCF